MRPGVLARIALAGALLLLTAGSAAAQQSGEGAPQKPPPINLRIPPPPPPAAASPPAEESAEAHAAQPAPPPLPAEVEIPAGTRFAVVLATPLSTRIATPGQTVVFTTREAVRLAHGLLLPPDTEFRGTVVEAKKPGAFGRAGKIRVAVNSLRLSHGAGAPVVARVDSAEADAISRAAADSTKAANLMDLVEWSLYGTMIGGQVRGGKGAAIGAGAGAAAALIFLMSRRGGDIYLEPGTPFSVFLERPVWLAGNDLYTAQQNYAQLHPNSPRRSSPEAGSATGEAHENSSAASEIARNPDDAVLDSDRPVLKRRPKQP